MAHKQAQFRQLFQRFGLAVSVIAVLFAGQVAPMYAQLPPDPIILELRGDLWAWSSSDAAMEQLTTWRLNEQPLLSPDGTKVVYLSGARVFADWLRTVQGAGGFIPPQNLWMLDIASRQTLPIATQPANAVWNGPGGPGLYILRSRPTWSSDSQQVAWVELAVDTLSLTSVGQRAMWQLITYDLETETSRVLDTASLEGHANPDLFNVRWGTPGIALQVRPNGFNAPWELRLYDASGSWIETSQYADPSDLGFAIGGWLGDQDLLLGSELDTQLDWHTGEMTIVDGAAELYSLSAPDGASFFMVQSHWYLALPGHDPIDLGEQIRPFGISRTGSAVVYGRWEADPVSTFYAYTVVVQSADQVIELGRYDTAQIIWGPVGWRIRQ